MQIAVQKRCRNLATVNVTVRMDEELKNQADELFSDLGLSFTAAITAFAKQAVREQRIPFILSRETSVKDIRDHVKKYHSESEDI